MTIRNPKFVPPNLENATAGHIVDELAKIRAMSNWLKKMGDLYKEALRARLPHVEVDSGLNDGRTIQVPVLNTTIEGERFKYLGFTEGSQYRLNTVKIDAEMDDEWKAKYKRHVPTQTLQLEAIGNDPKFEELNKWINTLKEELGLDD